MTATMEKEVRRIRAIRKELEGKRTALVNLPPDQISAEEEDRLFDLYSSEIMLTITAEYDAQVKAFKPSEWFKGFIESFGPCESKRISAKQAEIFAKYLPFAEQRSSFSSFHGTSFIIGARYKGKYQGKVYEVSAYNGCGYLTVRDTVTI